MRRVRLLVLALALALVLGACSALPESGPVHRDDDSDSQIGVNSARFTAPGPGKGDAPVQIVNGFLTAMTANPAVASQARSFLTKRARAEWNPVSSTLVYRSSTVSAGVGATVDAKLADAHRLDARGGWLGDAGDGAGRLTLTMVREKGEWRIDNPPNALLVPQYFLEQEYQPFNLYFFDKTQQILVPDRVYVPRGEQTASQLVRALLGGPSADLAPVTRTEFPARTELDLSVSVSADGTAEVPLSRQLLRLPPAKLKRAAAQLSWTLRQVPGVSEIRMAVDSAPVPVAGAREGTETQQADAYAPTADGAPDQVFSLTKGRLSVLDPIGTRPTTARPVSGPFGRPGYALRSFGVSLDGSSVAAVTADGEAVLRARLRSSPKGEAEQGTTSKTSTTPHRVYSGTDLLPPAYDALGDLVLVDRTASGAKVVEVSATGTQVIDVPGISGRAVKAFLLSRSGTQLVALISDLGGAGSGKGAPRGGVVTADLVRSPSGALVQALPAQRNGAVPSGTGDLVGLSWWSPNDVAVLGHAEKNRSRVALVSLDGSPGDPRTAVPDSWPGSALGLVGAPDRSATLYLITKSGRLRSLDPSGLWRRTGVSAGQVAPAYAG